MRVRYFATELTLCRIRGCTAMDAAANRARLMNTTAELSVR